jgi:hypothetical protein
MKKRCHSCARWELLNKKGSGCCQETRKKLGLVDLSDKGCWRPVGTILVSEEKPV